MGFFFIELGVGIGRVGLFFRGLSDANYFL